MNRKTEWVVTVEVWAVDAEDAAQQAAQDIRKGQPVQVQSVIQPGSTTVKLRAA